MRTKSKVFLSCATLAGMMLAAVGTMAADPPLPSSCTTTTSTWRVDITDGPCLVSDPSIPACSASGNYTGIKYTVTGSADHVATVVTKYNTVSTATGNQSYGACVGDPVTGLGKHSCHEKAVKLNPLNQTQAFWLVVSGLKSPVLQSVVAKKGSKTEGCAIAGLGAESTAAPVSEILKHGNCAVEFISDRVTGTVFSARLTATSPPTCDFFTDDVSNLEVKLRGQSLGVANFGQGYVETGLASCTTRIIGGRVYTWGDPCPD